MERSPWCDGDDLECRQTCPHFPYCGDGLREEGGQMTYCPVCGAPTHDVERVEAKITPASVPEGAEGYSVTRRYYMVVECEKGHLLVAGGGNGVMAECSLSFDKALRAWPLGRSFDDVRKVVG